MKFTSTIFTTTAAILSLSSMNTGVHATISPYVECCENNGGSYSITQGVDGQAGICTKDGTQYTDELFFQNFCESNDGPYSFSYEFPETTTDNFVHGLCVRGVSSSDISVTSNRGDLSYEKKSNWRNGVTMWGDRDYKSKDLITRAGNDSQCQGGIYLQPNKHKDIERGTSITVTVRYSDRYSFDLCATVNTENSAESVRDGGWPHSLPRNNFSASKEYKYEGVLSNPSIRGGGNTKEGEMIFYCRQFSGRH